MSTGREQPWKKTACIICALNCGVEVQTDGRRITKIRGDDAHPVSKGYVCEKSQRMDYYQNGADRLTSPMRRRPDGTYEAIDWDTAIGGNRLTTRCWNTSSGQPQPSVPRTKCSTLARSG